jgi:trehalose 6-phosphate synthase/phosphatase
MGKLLIVSNRLPFTVARRDHSVSLERSAGGLATGLGAVHDAGGSLWVGWCGAPRERLRGKEPEIRAMLEKHGCKPVFLSQSEIDAYYHGFSNRTVWPLFHYFPLYTTYDKDFWRGYQRVNQLFADEVAAAAEDGDLIWIHDYHLMLVPQMLRKKLPDATIGFFLHIPFPSSELFRMLPWRQEILEGVLGADLVGFHTYDYVRHFLTSVEQLIGWEHQLGYVDVGDRVVRVDAFPMGIDYKRYALAAEDETVKAEIKRIRRKVRTNRVVLSVDRMDFTKGIDQRLEVFDQFLDKYPQYRERVTMILVAVPSRTGVELYRSLKQRVDELVGRINGKYGSLGWMPIWYLYRSLPFRRLAALYAVADAALVTPQRDGMNLIAKEFVASKVDGKGVLILSELAGAAREMGEAIMVNPNNVDETVDAIRDALEMPPEEQIERNKAMQQRLVRYGVVRWVCDFIDRMGGVKVTQRERAVTRLGAGAWARIAEDYRRASTRLILLDYDGTLVPFHRDPLKARPDEDLIGTLVALAEAPGTQVVIISGRDRDRLEGWFGRLEVGLVAEHGVWLKEPGGEWRVVENLKTDWKEQVRPLLELYVDRTPGAFIEEKSYSLTWHYRRADPGLAAMRAREIRDALVNLTRNLSIGVMEGSKVLEVKELGVSKGRAVSKWMARAGWDFILAVGDDWTDEDMFAALPEWAYSIKVGMGQSRAKFNVGGPVEFRELLGRLRR